MATFDRPPDISHSKDSAKQQEKRQPQQVPSRRPLVRLIDNIWYIMCTPFPDLRNLSRKRDLDSRFVASIRLCDGFAAVLAYLALGVVSYRYVFEKWSFVDALYFTCVTFSTVGYGDICAKTLAGKFFSCVFGIAGIALLGAAVARIGSRLVAAEIEAVKKARKQSQRSLLQVYDKMPKAVMAFATGKSQEPQQGHAGRARTLGVDTTPTFSALSRNVLEGCAIHYPIVDAGSGGRPLYWVPRRLEMV